MAYLDQSSKKLSKKARTELVSKLDEYFSSSIDHPTWSDWRKNSLTCFKYKEGDQWTSTEKAELDKRKQPATVNNQVSVTIERMVGQFVKQKVRIGYRGRNPQDKAVADVLSDLFLFIRQNTGLEFEEREMADDGFTGGFGVLETGVTFNDNFEPEITIKHEDPFNIFPDPFSKRYNWNDDATYICRAKWVDMEEAKELYPDYEKEIEALSNDDSLSGRISNNSAVDSFRNENYIDTKRRRIRLVECQYKEKERESICLFGDGTVVDKDSLILTKPTGQKTQITKEKLVELKSGGLQYEEIDRINIKLKIGIFTSNILLDYKESKLKNFSFVPYFVHRKKSGEPYSLVFIALSMQDAINHRESKSISLLNNNRTFAEEGAITNKTDWAQEVARSDGIAVLNRGYFDKFKIDEHIDIGQIHFTMHNQAKDDFRRITGINPDALGEPSEVRSGVGIARKQAMTDVIIAPIFDNLRRTRQILAGNVLELIQVYYTEPKVF